MKTLITTLNSKYIHKSLSLRLLYVATNKQHDVDFKEYTIKDDTIHIVEDILYQKIEIVAFSVYIWNVEKIKEICMLLKQKKSDIIIIIGGPEVSYDVDYFLDHYQIDYLISGEGEIALNEVLNQIEQGALVEVQGVSSYLHRDYQQTKPVPLSYIESLDSPYVLPRDNDSMQNRILYFETSRGCPYQCQYCLSSLEKGLRFFSYEYITKQLDLILQTGVKTIKLLDRSFNAKTEHALAILQYLFTHYRPDVQFQFEINGDVLDQRIIDYIVEKAPPGLLRFEIGIQSTYEPTNEIVRRYQDFKRLSNVITQLQDSHKVDLHLDLIAGLPLESLERFAKSFDDVFAFHPKELQLGFLKLLRGTSLRKEYDTYGYVFDTQPPYEIISSDALSKKDIEAIHIAEDMLEKYWNSGKMKQTMSYIMTQIDSPFYFFLDLGVYYKKQEYKVLHFQNDELFYYLDEYTKSKNIDVHDMLIEDYLRLAKIKPKRWWQPSLDKAQTKQRMHMLIDTYHLNQEVVFRYGMLESLTNIDILAIYKDYQVTIYKYQKDE